jgi:hypothetical protein
MTTACRDNFGGSVWGKFSFAILVPRGITAGEPKMRQEVYRVAFDEARAELSEILGKFEQLRLRKDRIEKVVEALKPLINSNESQISSAPAERQPAKSEQSIVPTAEPVQATASPIPYPVQQAVAPSNDPFARRENGSGLSAVAADLKEYSRLFNTPVTQG